jgi:hypothetical integral membrane protein (TIGR02206 family)
MDHFWDPGHLTAVLFTIMAGSRLVMAARHSPGRWRNWVCAGLAIALVLNQSAYSLRGLWEHNWSIRYDLPLNLCDVAAFVAGGALILRRRWWVETTFFWAVGGSTMGILFPDLLLRTPSYGYFEYYTDHVGVVLAALLLVVGLGILPEAGAYRRICATTIGYTVVVGLFDLLSGANYFTLRAKASAGSLTPLGILSPWPWYVLEMTPVVLLALLILDMPFRRRETLRDRSPIAGAAAT